MILQQASGSSVSFLRIVTNGCHLLLRNYVPCRLGHQVTTLKANLGSAYSGQQSESKFYKKKTRNNKG